MASLIYSFAQLEAFTAVAEHGSLMKAASKLGKDRTTLRDLIDFLEDGLGYALFLREGRSLRLTPEGGAASAAGAPADAAGQSV